jgi:16S rRNA (guanine966-N2)-methyltransferase
MRIIAGAWRGKTLTAPPGSTTRPTADRVRQSLFDMLRHAPWSTHDLLDGAQVLDAFAGTGALGLEALSRGAASATFFERDRAALACLRANVTACGAASRARIIAGDVLHPGPGQPHSLIFLDPPYGQGLVQRSINILRAEGWLRPGSVVVAESSTTDSDLDSVVETGLLLHHRLQGAAQLHVWRE